MNIKPQRSYEAINLTGDIPMLPTTAIQPIESVYDPISFEDNFTVKENLFPYIYHNPRHKVIGVYEAENGMKIETHMIHALPHVPRNNDLVYIPGWTERPEVGTAANIIEELAARNLGSRIISFANNGLNKYGTTMGVRASLRDTWDDMAEPRLAAMEALEDEQPFDIVAESMGCPITTAMMHRLKNGEHERVKVGNVVMHSGAVVPRRKTFEAMVVDFPRLLALDATRVAASHPLEALKCADLRPDLLHPRSWATVGAQALHLLKGTEYDQLDAVADDFYIGAINGTNDPLPQAQFWADLQGAHPDRVIVTTKEGDGHAASVKYRDAGNDIMNTIRQLNELRELNELQKPS